MARETIEYPLSDMLKSVYDPDEDGVIALSELDPLVCSEPELAIHAGVAGAHHTKYTDGDAMVWAIVLGG